MVKKLYIGNLAEGVTEDDLMANFSEIGKVVSLAIIRDKITGLSRGWQRKRRPRKPSKHSTAANCSAGQSGSTRPNRREIRTNGPGERAAGAAVLAAKRLDAAAAPGGVAVGAGRTPVLILLPRRKRPD